MWWGLGFLVIVMIRDFFGGFASGFMKAQREKLINKHKSQETEKTNAPRP